MILLLWKCYSMKIKFPEGLALQLIKALSIPYSGKFSEGEIFGNFGKNQ